MRTQLFRWLGPQQLRSSRAGKQKTGSRGATMAGAFPGSQPNSNPTMQVHFSELYHWIGPVPLTLSEH